MEFLSRLLDAILIVILTAFLNFLYFTYLFYRKRKYKKLFKFKDGEENKIVITAFESANARPQTGYGELLALANINRSIGLSFSKEEIPKIVNGVYLSSISSFPEAEYANNLIVIGGATHNSVMREFKEKLSGIVQIIARDELSQVAENRDFCFFDKITNEKFIANIETNPYKVKTDIGLITRVANPLNKHKTLLLIDGLHTYGLIAASQFFLPENLDKFYKKVNRLDDNYFQIVVKANVMGLQVFIDDVSYVQLKQ